MNIHVHINHQNRRINQIAFIYLFLLAINSVNILEYSFFFTSKKKLNNDEIITDEQLQQNKHQR